MEGRELPVGWVEAQVGEVCRLLNGRAYSKSELLESGKYRVLRVGNLFTNPNWYHSDLELDEDKYCQAGDLLYAWSASFGPHVWEGERVIYHYHIWKVEQDEDLIHRDFLKVFFQWDTNRIKQQQGSGSTMLHVTKKSMEERAIPVPPTPEQRRIAAKLDTTLAAVESCRQRLDGVAAILKRFRQAVLAAATSGELTREWREESGFDFDWPEVQLGDHAVGFNYGTSAKSQRKGEIPVLRMGNIQAGEIDWVDLVYTSDLKEIAKYMLDSGDVLFNRTNSPELVGKTAVYRGEQPAIYAGYLIRVRCSASLDPEFLNLSLNSPQGRDYCWSVKSDGVSQSNINAKKLAAYPFELPPIEEQGEIVRRAQALFSIAGQLETRLNTSRNVVDRLTPALLAIAFRGELVPQDPNEEPASELLAKLKAKQSNAAQVSPRRRVKQPTRRQTMSISEKDSMKAAILSLEADRFSFDELRDQAGGAYESLKGILFELLEEPSPVVRQVFDQEAKAMKLERIRP